jgi:sodium/proline symporter
VSVIGVSFTIYTLLIVAVGVYSARFARRSDEDYFLAGRALGPWVAALSACASGSSGWVTMGLVGFGYIHGLRALWLVPGVVLGIMFNWFVLAGRMRDRAADTGALTIPDLMAFHFNERRPILRILSVVVILSAMFLYVAAQFAAAGQAFAATFENVSYQTGVVIGVVAVLAYTVIGGFRAACWTDFAQGMLMLVVLVGMPIYLLFDLGFGQTVQTLHDSDPALTQWIPAGESTGLALIGFLFGSGALGVNFGYPGQPHVLVRFMALKNRRDARIGGFISVTWAALSYGGAALIGIFARAESIRGAEWGAEMLADPQGKGELALVISSQHLLPGAIAGMALAAILAAIASTADSQLIVAASSAANDIYARMVERVHRTAHVWINRSVVFGLGVGAGLLVIDQNVRVYTYVLTYGWAMLGAAFGPQLILMLLWKRATYAGCLAGMFTGFCVAIAWPQIYKPGPDDPQIYNLTLAFICALIVNVGVCLFTRPPEPLFEEV